MTASNSTIATLHDLLDFYSGKFSSFEIQLKRALPEWIEKADSVKLKIVLQKYLDFVEEHINKIDSFFVAEGISPVMPDHRVMHAIVEETNENLLNCKDPQVRDACLLASVQLVNHFKVSAYGTASAFAAALGMEKWAVLFHEAEVNEKHIDDRLTQLANYEINIKAKTPIVLQS